MPSDEVLVIAIRSANLSQMCVVGPFGLLLATMRVDSVKMVYKTTRVVSYRVFAIEVQHFFVVAAFR